MKIDKYNKFLIKVMTMMPPLLGVLVFSYVVKFSGVDSVIQRLPVFQGVTSFFSLMLIGFTYIRNRNAITGRKILPMLFFMLVFPILGYYFAEMEMEFTVLMALVSFISSCILYLLLLLGRVFYYLLYSIVNSVLMPMMLIIHEYIIVLVFIILLILAFRIYKKIKIGLELFQFENEGLDVLKSIFLHSSLLILPFFDYIIQHTIGEESYENYVLLYKYLNGGVTLLFSYKQLNLMFSKNLDGMNWILKILFVIILLSFFGIFYQNFVIFALMIALFSLGVNFSSLIVRNQLMKGVGFLFSLIGLVFVGGYFVGLHVFKQSIESNPQLFLLMMVLSTVLPSVMLFKLSKR